MVNFAVINHKTCYMKNFLALVVFITVSIPAFGQNTAVGDKVNALEKELKTTRSSLDSLKSEVSSIQFRLNELADRNAEYKKALDIRQTLNATDGDGYQYAFVSAVGDTKTGTLTVTFSIFNPKEQEKGKQISSTYFSDYEGNAYKTYDAKFGNIGSMATIDTNTSMKIFIPFEKIPTTLKRIDSLTIDAYSSSYSGPNSMKINFRDLPVQWK